MLWDWDSGMVLHVLDEMVLPLLRMVSLLVNGTLVVDQGSSALQSRKRSSL